MPDKKSGYQSSSNSACEDGKSLLSLRRNSFPCPHRRLDPPSPAISMSTLHIQEESEEDEAQLIFHPYRRQSLAVPGYHSQTANWTPAISIRPASSQSHSLAYENTNFLFSPDKRATDWHRHCQSDTDLRLEWSHLAQTESDNVFHFEESWEDGLRSGRVSV